MLYIEPASIVTPEGLLEERAILIDGERIVAVDYASRLPCPAGAYRLEAAGLLLAPGFIDLQINGAFGGDFTDEPGTIWQVASLLPRYGITSFLPTIVSSPYETVAAAQAAICEGPPPGFRGAIPLGLHLEGPFLNPAKRGAHNPTHLRLPDTAEAQSWTPDRGIRLVTLAPELPGACEMIEMLMARGIVVSAGHSLANYEEGVAGINAGITYGTHLFNVMPVMDHREPGLVGALLGDGRVTVGLIADGIHLHPSMVALAWKAKGPSRISLVTDAMAALGMSDGTYKLGDQDVIVAGGAARLADGRLAGSVLTLDQAVRNLVSFAGCSPSDAILAVTTVPASLLGMANSLARIASGSRADVVLLNSDLRVVETLVAGEVVYSTRGDK
ncbi:MAG TPA: N-acetylglucosamine-6-phosphate deacetylase [Chloroflexia bacterium]|nr:N-acetylglucosamine-6-phosphate deacetylase [Chloroflexia bacterium]